MASFDTHVWKDVCDYKYTAKDIHGVIIHVLCYISTNSSRLVLQTYLTLGFLWIYHAC